MIVYFYSGSSMAGTFHSGDVLFLSTTRIPRIGDVVVFDSTIHAAPVVHRIIARLPGNQYRTRGDGNRRVDAEFVALDQIQGVVIERRTRRRRVRVSGGSAGRTTHCVRRFCRFLLRWALRTVRPLYIRLRQMDWPAQVFQPRMFRTRFNLENRPVIKLIWRSRTAGMIDQQSGFQGNPPYELLVNNNDKHWNEENF